MQSEVGKLSKAFEGGFGDEMGLGLDLQYLQNLNPEREEDRGGRTLNGEMMPPRKGSVHSGFSDSAGRKEGPVTPFLRSALGGISKRRGSREGGK